MLKICRDNWYKHKGKLEERIKDDINKRWTYEELFKLTVDTILEEKNLNTENITIINDGEYQGTLIFIIYDAYYQPSPWQYYMTYIFYGSCSVCDTLQRVYDTEDGESKLEDLMYICKNFIENMTCPWDDKEEAKW